MHSLQFKTYNVTYPSNWNELDKEQLLFISQLYVSELEKERFNILAMQAFTQIKWKDFFKIPQECFTDFDKTLEWLHKSCELTINLLPKINHNQNVFYGPGDTMLNFTFEQFFGHTEPAFTNYLKTNDVQWLDYLFSAIYSFNADKDFKPNKVEKNIDKVKQLPAKYKQAALLYYIGCRDLITNKFPLLFKKKKTVGKASDMHYFEMVDNLNNESLADNEKIKSSNIWESLLRLTNMIEKAQKLKSKQ